MLSPRPTTSLCSAASEAFALWRGVEASAEGARGLLHLCGSIDIAPVRGSSAASDVLGAMQDASRVCAGVGASAGGAAVSVQAMSMSMSCVVASA